MKEQQDYNKRPLNTVFILGSGFTKDIASNYPTLSELSRSMVESMESYLENPDILSLSKPSMTNHASLRDAFKTKIPENIKNNIEHLMTFLYTTYPWRDEVDRNLTAAMYEVVIQNLRHGFNEIRNSYGDSLYKYNSIERLLKFWHKNESAVITFNYDTVVEEIASKILQRKDIYQKKPEANFKKINGAHICVRPEMFGDNSREGVSVGKAYQDIPVISVPDRNPNHLSTIFDKIWKVCPTVDVDKDVRHDEALIREMYSHLQDPVGPECIYQVATANILRRVTTIFAPQIFNSFKYIKLHGSTNWYYTGSKDNPSDIIYYVPIANNRSIDRMKLDRSLSGAKSLVIPPLLDKSAFYVHPGIEAQWQLARGYIAKAEKIVVIGYSLPETDLATRFLFQEALIKSKADLRVVCKCVDEEFNSIKSRYLNILGNDESRLEIANVQGDNSSVDLILDEIASEK